VFQGSKGVVIIGPAGLGGERGKAGPPGRAVKGPLAAVKGPAGRNRKINLKQ